VTCNASPRTYQVIDTKLQEDVDMSEAPPQIRNLAERLIAHETRGNKSSGTRTPAAFPVVEKLRPKLATLIGDAGFRALLSRALARAKAGVPSLRAVQVEADGALRGLAGLEAQADPREIAEGRVVLLAQLLGMLVAFIGEDLTLRLVREVWPKFSLNSLDVSRRQR
jgi:hypothetical protein